MDLPLALFVNDGGHHQCRSEWTAGVAQQTLAPLQYSQLQLNLPEQESRGTSNKLASHFRKDALLEEQKNYYRLNSGAWQ